MDYVRPSYNEVKARITADLAAVPAVLRDRLSAALARADYGQYGYLEWIDRQCSPLTCELERLADWAALYGVTRLFATTASGNVIATGNPGTDILADTLLRGQNGLDYIVLEAVTLGVGDTPVLVRSATVGSATNMIAGQTLTLIDPIPGVDGTLTVDATGLTGGAEDELVEDWRVRVADEWSTVVTRGARSGKPDDYRAWAKAAHPSVTTALIRKHVLGLGTVLVLPICNTLPNRLPSPAVLTAIATKFEDLAPATADWRIGSPTIKPVTVEIDLFPAADNAPNRTAIAAALNALTLAEQGENSVLALAEIDAAIATVTTQYTRISPLLDQAVAAGEVFVLQPVVWA